MKHLVYFCLIALCFGCNSYEEPPQKVNIVYYTDAELSEMSKLMNYMYAHNMGIKEDIKNGKISSQFPEHFLTIHTAELTKTKQRGEEFEYYSNQFIQVEKELYDENSDIDLKTRYNNAVNLCISCHQNECPGPVTKIKKLLIK